MKEPDHKKSKYFRTWYLFVVSFLLALFALYSEDHSKLISNFYTYLRGDGHSLYLLLILVLPVYFLSLAIVLAFSAKSVKKDHSQVSDINLEKVRATTLEKESQGRSEGIASTKKYIVSKSEQNLYENGVIALKNLMDEKIYRESDLRSADLAERLKIPKYQIGPIIKATGFKDFPSLINHYRIKEACRLLDADPGMNIKEVYYEVGFKTKQHFLNTFQKLIGCNPTQYRLRE